jgi:hypothetical protein
LTAAPLFAVALIAVPFEVFPMLRQLPDEEQVPLSGSVIARAVLAASKKLVAHETIATMDARRVMR